MTDLLPLNRNAGKREGDDFANETGHETETLDTKEKVENEDNDKINGENMKKGEMGEDESHEENA